MDDKMNQNKQTPEETTGADHAESPTAQGGSSQVYTAKNQHFAFRGKATPDGNGYTTPSGGHGYVYAPISYGTAYGTASHRRKNRHTGLVILAVMVVLALVGIGWFLGMRWGGGNRVSPLTENGDTAATAGEDDVTRNGSFIVIEPQETEAEASGVDESYSDFSTPSLNRTEEPEQQENDASTEGNVNRDVLMDTDDHLSVAILVCDPEVFSKKSPLRSDADGDGKPDIALDENGHVLTSADKQILTKATVVYRVADTVVEISTETVTQSGRTGTYVTGGAGSGVIISQEGYIVTNHHVIDGADTITVTLTDGTRYVADLIGTDARTDVALLKINAAGKPLAVAMMGCSYDLVVGEEILAIGNPLGSLGGTVTEGIVSATARQILMDGNRMTLLQVSAPINPGNSGGGLFNLAGELVGIVNAKYSDEQVEGLGFAIPVDIAYEIILELYEYGYVRGRPDTGLTLMDVTSGSTAWRYFRSPYTGVYVEASALTEALQYGDLILSFGGVEVSTSAEINRVVGTLSVGDTVEVLIYRGGNKLTVTLTLGEYCPVSAIPVA